ncbi:MAG: biopolymer transporter ExbD [Candidatus Krumholzibacteria bacterium]|jgi:biopolymer transport protein ExbD|nr:biopolymer transporter ExbD [Candidatus Krumholzibacteria bacterium]
MSVQKKRKKKQPLGEVTMASTADISFLLLIFFIVSTIFAEEQGLVMLLPAKQTSAEDVVQVPERLLATIRINYDNSLTYDRKPVQLNQVMNVIKARIEANERTVVVLETHPDAHYGMMVACLDELKLANARRLTLRTSRR